MFESIVLALATVALSVAFVGKTLDGNGGLMGAFRESSHSLAILVDRNTATGAGFRNGINGFPAPSEGRGFWHDN